MPDLPDVLAWVAHELRGRLSAIDLALRLVIDERDEAERRELHATALAEATRLRTLIDGLADPALADPARVRAVAFRTATAVDAALAEVAGAAGERRLRLVSTVADGDRRGDAERLARLLAHALAHAVRTARAGATLTLADAGTGFTLTWDADPAAPVETARSWLAGRYAEALGMGCTVGSGRIAIG